MTSATRAVPLRRPAVVGFVTGFASAFAATVLALVSTVFEALLPVLVPAALLLRPIADRMADWNGLLTMLLVGTLNGAVYAVAFAAVAALLRIGRSGRGQR
jgi:hypothetical protein